MSATRTMRARAALALAAVLLAAPRAAAVTHLGHGDTPPPIDLKRLDGTPVTLEEQHGHATVVVFGELYHQRTLEACREIKEAIESDALAGRPVTLMLVVAQDAPTAELRERARDERLPRLIAHDSDRSVFGAYRVAVMPSVVVIDAEGRVVHAAAGYSSRLKDIVTDALRVATGRMTYEQFESLLHPQASEVDEQRLRAARITGLAQQLARRGLGAMAEAKYREALDLAPDYAPARLGLAMGLLEGRHLAVAEQEFRATLDADPASVEAALGLACVQTARGGAELDAAADILRDVLRRDPEEPRALYLLGLVHEQRGETDDALAALRRSAELLMSRREGWHVVPGRQDTHDLEPSRP